MIRDPYQVFLKHQLVFDFLEKNSALHVGLVNIVQ